MSLAFQTVVLFLAVFWTEGCTELGRENCTHMISTLQDLWTGSYEPNSTVCVTLSSPETLDYSATPLGFNVMITGNNHPVSCRIDAAVKNLTSYTHFPLVFYNASFVSISGLQIDGCKRPLQFQWIKTIEISSSSFTNFDIGGSVEIFNSPKICIQDSLFANDTSLGISNRSFSGNAGGVAIGYYNTEHLHDYMPEITIMRSSFINNYANAGEDLRFTVIQVLRKRIYNQRGGGMAFYFGEDDYRGSVTVKDCIFTDNVAADSGGGIYMFLSGGMGSFQTVVIDNTSFTGNRALDGGGLEITHSNPDSENSPNNISVINCRFDNNFGKFGGGYKNIQLNDLTNLNYVFVRDTEFNNNIADVGAGIYLQSVVTVKKVTLLKRNELENCNFTNNNGSRGVVFVIGNVVTIKGNTRFEGSLGPALRVLGTLVVLEGNILFKRNQHHPEGFSGALYLSSFGQIVLHEGTNITFQENIGRDGACIVVRGQLIAAAFTQQLYNPQCFLQYFDPTVPPPDWRVSMDFFGNRANVGPVVYLSNGTICLWSNDNSPFFSKDLQSTWMFMTMRDNYANGIDDSRAYIQTGIAELNLSTTYESAYPGQKITVDARAVDQFGQDTTAFIEISTNDSNVTFEPSIVPIGPSNGVIEFQFMGSINDSVNTTVEFNPFFIPDQNAKRFILHHEACLPGYNLSDDNVCECTATKEVILCDDNDEYLLLANGLWGAPPNWSQQLVTYPCPPGYCSCTGAVNDTELSEGCQLLFRQPEVICHETRRRDDKDNVLCGKCKKRYGVGLLTNNCREHKRTIAVWLLPIYIIAAVVSMVLLVRLAIHLPTILRSFLFYIQVTPIAVAYFPNIFGLSSEVTSCIGSTLALYIPYDFSLYSEMPSLVSYALRYIAPVIALIVVPLAARVRRYRSKYWHGIWTIVLLMYVMTLETSVSLLFCPTLRRSQGPITVWFFDGNVECYSDWHIPLAILAFASLFGLALLILFVAAAIYYKTLRRKYVKFERLERVSDALTRGFKDEYKWWPIMELGCRFIFVTSVVLTPGYVVVPLVLSIVIFVLQTFIHPYRSIAANYTESVLFLWLVCLLGLGNTTALQETLAEGDREPVWPDALLYIPVAVALVVTVVHSILLVRKLLLPHKEKIKKKLKMAGSVRHYTVSYNLRKQRLQNQDTDVTKTIIGLDDEIR